MTCGIINNGLASEQDVILTDSDQLLIDCYVQSQFIITERKDPPTIEGFSYKFTACTDNGAPAMDVYQDENEEVKEVEMDRPTPCKGCFGYGNCDFEHCGIWLEWIAAEVIASIEGTQGVH